MKNISRAVLVSFLCAGAAACAAGGPTTAVGSGSAEPGGERNNAEAPAVHYVDPRWGYQVDGPGQMTASSDGVASVIGPLERLEILVRQGSEAADPAAAAATDLATLRTSATAFRLISGPSVARIGSRDVEKLVYSWTDGTSSVTGKPVLLVSVRYYIPKNASTLAVLIYGVIANQYDPEGADDVAVTFAWR